MVWAEITFAVALDHDKTGHTFSRLISNMQIRRRLGIEVRGNLADAGLDGVKSRHWI